ncbi:unnamed protein product [Hyaloperonospora brassicae]|uniref:Chromo domain-containing protein n=1 Tax=Hyaloperonospora brassicae TaxID=162125 RepID=A0AAV0V3U8_HYABA|nr:unnamed protein product [Hyaloperonospora brassicae]
MRSKHMELFAKMHLGMDHVLAKLLLEAPRLPDSLKLETETQSLSITWVQVTEVFEKRRAMLERRKEKEKRKKEKIEREEKASGGKEVVEKFETKERRDAMKAVAIATPMKKSKNSPSGASPRSGKSALVSVETEKKSSKTKQKKKKKKEREKKEKKEEEEEEEEKKRKEEPLTTMASPRGEGVKAAGANEKKADERSVRDQLMLKKIRKLPMCQDVAFGSNKYKAIAKWIELDKGDNASIPAEVAKILDEMQSDAATETKSKQKWSRKRSFESRDGVVPAEKRSTRQSSAEDRKRDEKQHTSHVDEGKMVRQSGKDEAAVKAHEEPPALEKAEFAPDLSNGPRFSPSSNETSQGRMPKKQKQTKEAPVGDGEEKKPICQAASTKQQPAAGAVQARANKGVCEAEAKYLFYENMEKPSKPGASADSAIILDDSEEEDDEDDEGEEDSDDAGEEELKEVQEHDSSTDDDPDLFDLNEEDVYVVEAILCVKEGRALLSVGGVRRPKESDLYLVKWEGYDELTWEPEENIPQRLIEMFRERERAKRACQYQIKVAHERREVTNVTTQTKDVIYMIQWINQDVALWEARATLPIKTQVWLDKVLGSASAKKR